jgi:ribosome-associated protein
MSEELPVINVSIQPIELCKLLKIANMVSGGGEAKIVISEGYVYVNGEVEFQKRKKIYEGDVIEFNGEAVQVACLPNKFKAESTKKDNKNTLNKTKKKQGAKQQKNINEVVNSPAIPGKRRPISF